jgi:hypothetical protein
MYVTMPRHKQPPGGAEPLCTAVGDDREPSSSLLIDRLHVREHSRGYSDSFESNTHRLLTIVLTGVPVEFAYIDIDIDIDIDT